jgi:hypothetical protein
MSEIKDVMSEWLQLKAQLKAARADLSVLNKREKELKELVQRFMKTESTDVVKIHQSKISLSSKNVKGSMTKEAVLTGLRNFFGGNEAQVEGAFQAIQDAIPVKERDTLSVRKWA